jgi:hypothetical protein
MVNINIAVPDDLHKKLRVEAAVKDTTLKDLIIAVLDEQIKTSSGSKPKSGNGNKINKNREVRL